MKASAAALGGGTPAHPRRAPVWAAPAVTPAGTATEAAAQRTISLAPRPFLTRAQLRRASRGGATDDAVSLPGTVALSDASAAGQDGAAAADTAASSSADDDVQATIWSRYAHRRKQTQSPESVTPSSPAFLSYVSPIFSSRLVSFSRSSASIVNLHYFCALPSLPLHRSEHGGC